MNPHRAHIAALRRNADRLQSGVDWNRKTKAKDRQWPLRAQESTVEDLRRQADEMEAGMDALELEQCER